MHKRSLVLLSAFALAFCVPVLHASDAGSKDAAKNKKTASKKHKSTSTNATPTKATPTKKRKNITSMTKPSGNTSPDQTTITPGTSPNGGQSSYDSKKGRRYPEPPKKKKP